MNTIVVELFVHPWWVDVLVILGMITFVCGILMGIKSIWYCMRNAQIMKTANDYNQKLSNTTENQSEPNIPMQLTENAIFAAQDRLAIPEMIMGDKLEILTENDTDINDDENNNKNNKNKNNKKTTGPTNNKNNNSNNNSNNTNSNNENENENEAQYVEYESAEDNKQHDIDDIHDIHDIHQTMDHLDISTIEDISAAEITRRDKKKRSRHRADPSLGGLMNSIDGMMTSLRNVTSMHLSNAGSNVIDNLTDIELDDSDVASSDNFSDDNDNEGQSDSDQLHSRDLRQSLKLAGASSFILKQLDPELLRRQSTLGGDGGGADGDNETSVGETSVVYADDIDVDDIDEDVDDVDDVDEPGVAVANSNDEIVNNISKGDKHVMICGTIDEESVDTEGGMIYLNESGSDDGQDSDKSF